MDFNTPPNPLSQIPSNAPLTKKNMHYEYFLLAIAVVVLGAGICWWQINQLNKESTYEMVVSPTPNASQEEISNLNSDLQAADTTDLDAEFKQVDNDLNSL
jgi:hypothetical protein